MVSTVDSSQSAPRKHALLYAHLERSRPPCSSPGLAEMLELRDDTGESLFPSETEARSPATEAKNGEDQCSNA